MSMSDDDAIAAEPALLTWALALTKDATEAEAMVALTLEKAKTQRRRGQSAIADRVLLYRLLRETYHSVERSRGRRPTRDATLTAMAANPGGQEAEPAAEDTQTA